MTAQTTTIQEDLDRKVEQIRANQDLSAEAKRRYIAEAYEKAAADYREAVEAQERELQERIHGTERSVFETRYPMAATDTEKAQIRAARRGAYDAVYFAVAGAGADGPAHAREELERILERAERTGDPELATAVYNVATERGVREVADAYLSARPQEKRRWEEYVEARQEAEDLNRVMDQAMGYGLMKPPELE